MEPQGIAALSRFLSHSQIYILIYGGTFRYQCSRYQDFTGLDMAVWALAKLLSFYVEVYYVMGKELTDKLSCMQTGH